MPKFGESIMFWWRGRLVSLSRDIINEHEDHFMKQWITCR